MTALQRHLDRSQRQRQQAAAQQMPDGPDGPDAPDVSAHVHCVEHHAADPAAHEGQKAEAAGAVGAGFERAQIGRCPAGWPPRPRFKGMATSHRERYLSGFRALDRANKNRLKPASLLAVAVGRDAERSPAGCWRCPGPDCGVNRGCRRPNQARASPRLSAVAGLRVGKLRECLLEAFVCAPTALIRSSMPVELASNSAVRLWTYSPTASFTSLSTGFDSRAGGVTEPTGNAGLRRG